VSRLLRLRSLSLALTCCSLTTCRPRALESVAPAALDLGDASVARTLALAAGTWDWHRGDSTCLGNRHTVRFSEDKRHMLLEFDAPIDTVTGRRITRYRMLSAGNRVIPGLPFVIRAEIEGETRRTDAGVPVVWDLILASLNRYHWHRTDWPDGGITNAVIRCDGRKPLEKPAAMDPRGRIS
jgi:hypothetical protein